MSCSNYIFILYAIPCLKGLGKDIRKTRRRRFWFWDLVRHILRVLTVNEFSITAQSRVSESGEILLHGRHLHTCNIYSTSYLSVARWCKNSAWRRHQMETFSALLAFCAGNSPTHGAHYDVIVMGASSVILTSSSQNIPSSDERVFNYLLPFFYFNWDEHTSPKKLQSLTVENTE